MKNKIVTSIKKLFYLSKNNSIKWSGYFEIYEELFRPFKNKNITFVEIGVKNGGSLEIWKKYFGKQSRIIGIDINPKCQIFEKDGYEIFIGNQSSPEFWNFFFKKVGKVDIILDDGGHTNIDQITTTINTVSKIKNNGLLVIEDIHTSYSKEYNSSIKYSFINYTKKLIDEINLNSNSFFRKHVYSINFFEKIVAFKINRLKCKFNVSIQNGKKNHNIEDLTWTANELYINHINNFFSYIPFISLRKIKRFIKNRVNTSKIKKYFY